MNLLYTKKKVFARYFFSFFDIVHARGMKKESITHFFCKEVDEWGKIC